jgi:hypothetical protein
MNKSGSVAVPLAFVADGSSKAPRPFVSIVKVASFGVFH